MNSTITENDYPVQTIWVFKSILRFLLILAIFIFIIVISGTNNYLSFFSNVIFIIFYIVFYIILSALRRMTFHYSVENNFLTLQQGILSRQQRHIPYGVIQNLFVKQDVFDRIFGLASVSIENASAGAGSQAGTQKFFGITIKNQRKQQIEMVGFSGNKVSIPGLTKDDAEKLKVIILQKMKENPVEDNQSGL
jgi:uncharacterized membrane protein YdbT with pleckstrin-like domain